jgi:Holliday junction resolvase RusA-like endonuclease
MVAHLTNADWQKLLARIEPALVKVSRSPAEVLAAAASVKPLARAVHRPDRIVGSIPGKPIGKPRMTRRDKWLKRPCVLAYREWADKAREVMGELPPATAVDEIRVTAYFQPPESWSKKKRIAAIGTKHRVKPDADNVLKCLDALFKQDSGIADAVVRKRWDWVSRLEIEILLTPSMN